MLKSIEDINGVDVDPNTLTSILTWTSDGNSDFLGFTGTGSYSGMFYLMVELPEESNKLYYAYQTSPSNRTAYVVDRIQKFPENTVVSLYVKHDSSGVETFLGTFLGAESE